MVDPNVRAGWASWNEQWEGLSPTMYGDAHLPHLIVTVGIGCALPTAENAVQLPFHHEDTSPATPDEIRVEWEAVNNSEGGHTVAWYVEELGLKLRLPAPAITALCLERLDSIAAHLEARFCDFEAWPASAQWATCSMAYALGVSRLLSPEWPKLHAALDAQDWAAAAVQSFVRGPGLAGRNKANHELFMAAAS